MEVYQSQSLPVDAMRASRLERLIAEASLTLPAGTGSAIREALVHNRLSRYNNLPHKSPRIARTGRRRVLLVDQVFEDVSVQKALGSAASPYAR